MTEQERNLSKQEIEQTLANLEFQVGCWHQDCLAEGYTDENLRGLEDAEKELNEFRAKYGSLQ